MTKIFSQEFLALVLARQWLEALIIEYEVDPSGSFMQVLRSRPDGTTVGVKIVRLSDLLLDLDRLNVPRPKFPSND